MSEEQEFRDLIRKVRAGDQQAAADLVREYETEIRRAVRIRLTDPTLYRVLDSMDVCQSVLANFFVRASAGQFEIDRPDQLLRLLVTMARNKLLDQARKQHSSRRDSRRIEAGPSGQLEAVADADAATPSQIVSEKELLQAMREQLTDDERFLADQRALGRDWSEIAKEAGGSAEALRKKLARALDRVARQLGLDAFQED
ncbi:MAG: sigma-70 family RNA polymerase sigma factor [Gemmataceae bacterium]|nr:sigma-70 family RNA polymerase sigma factor [Gemmataceae bacterium]